ncbi:hypothetical protein BJ912DRAFT_933155 [Pholiota molesta]|nr:hypothetical protein BJ912DRAFT_933155 [Pholiota molesta]
MPPASARTRIVFAVPALPRIRSLPFPNIAVRLRNANEPNLQRLRQQLINLLLDIGHARCRHRVLSSNSSVRGIHARVSSFSEPLMHAAAVWMEGGGRKRLRRPANVRWISQRLSEGGPWLLVREARFRRSSRRCGVVVRAGRAWLVGQETDGLGWVMQSISVNDACSGVSVRSTSYTSSLRRCELCFSEQGEDVGFGGRVGFNWGERRREDRGKWLVPGSAKEME